MGSMGAVVRARAATVTSPPAKTVKSPPKLSAVRSISALRLTLALASKSMPSLDPNPTLCAKMGPFCVMSVRASTLYVPPSPSGDAPFTSIRPAVVTLAPLLEIEMSPPAPPSMSSPEPLARMSPFMVTTPPAITVRKPPSPTPEACMSTTPSTVVVTSVPAVMSTLQLLQSPPLATSWVLTWTEPRVASISIAPPPPCALPSDRIPSLGSPVTVTLPVADVMVMDPPKPSRFVALAMSVPSIDRFPCEVSTIAPPPKFPLTSMRDLLVPWLWMSMVVSDARATVTVPSLPGATIRAPGWKVTAAAWIWNVPMPLTVIVRLLLIWKGRFPRS